MGKKRLPPLSPTETEVLAQVWSLQKATVQEVCDKLSRTRRIVYPTVQTMLRRLEKKGYIDHELKGKAHVFFPVEKQDQVVGKVVGEFVQRLFGGDPIPLMHHLAKGSKMTVADIEALKKLIDED